jgi:hypothetical protein
MRKDLAELLEKYEPLGQWKAGELLLRPADAHRFADDIQALGDVGISGVDIWYPVDAGICEDPGCLDSGMVGNDNEGLEFSIRAAKQFISEQLPPHISLVSFVL